MNNDSHENVADSTDWLSTPLSGLAAVEAALRCQICKDFYKTPMLTSCNHSFCSICIRRALATDGKCPQCRESDQERKLRSNWPMEDVVAAFTHARAAVLEFAQRPPAPAQSSLLPLPPPPPPPQAISSKRKITDGDDASDAQLNSNINNNKRLRSSARLSKARGMEATSEMARQEAYIPDPELEPEHDEPEFVPEPEPEPEVEMVEPNDGLVACPICWKRMKEALVSRHIDTSCPGEPQPQPSHSFSSSSKPPPSGIASAFTPITTTTNKFTTSPAKQKHRPDRLPTLNYSMLRDAQLRKELGDLGLLTTGNRSVLERRHREWVMIWNANCDSQRPRQRAQLLQALDVWERTLGSRAPPPGRGKTVRDKDFDGTAWATTHDASFKDLIASARKSRDKTAGTGAGKQQTNPPDSHSGGAAGQGEKKAGEGEGEVNTLSASQTPSSSTSIPGPADSKLHNAEIICREAPPPCALLPERGTTNLTHDNNDIMDLERDRDTSKKERGSISTSTSISPILPYPYPSR
ncbi:hypothetical protein F5Y17DRAFT_420964 [Xylariaceae sp. FL0594]|nr:hypothetical protein F5Y17DRAFT_420964 [Xylariaceae sp. FL0594]